MTMRKLLLFFVFAGAVQAGIVTTYPWCVGGSAAAPQIFPCVAPTSVVVKIGPAVGVSMGGGFNFIFVPAATAPTVALAGAGAGNVDNGSHDYYVTFISPAGETDWENVATVTVIDQTTDGKVSVTNIPLGPPGTTGRRLLRSVSYGTGYTGSGIFPSSLSMIADNTTTSYLDDTPDSDLGSPIPQQNTTAGQLGVNGQPYGIQLSPPGNALEFGISSYLLFVDPTMPAGTTGNVASISEYVSGSGGLVTAAQSSGGLIPGWLVNLGIAGDAPFSGAAYHITAYRTDPGLESLADGEVILTVDDGSAFDGGFPSFAVVSMFNGSFDAGYPQGGQRVGVNDIAPASVLSVVNPTNAVGANAISRVVASFERTTGQTADIADFLNESGSALSTVDVNGHGLFNLLGGYGAAPGISGCSASISSDSTNVSGEITSGTSGSCTVALTWANSQAFKQGAACSVANQTHPGTTNLVQQTGYTQSTVTLTGVTVSGDVLEYFCGGR